MSNRPIIISLLILLTVSCACQVTAPTPVAEEVEGAEPASTSALEIIPTIASTPVILRVTEHPLPTPDSICPGAAPPRVAPGQETSVVANNSDKLKLRSKPMISPDTVIMELDQFTKLKILEGFVCVHSDETQTSYWFWKVEVIPTGEIGWVAEGDELHYFIE